MPATKPGPSTTGAGRATRTTPRDLKRYSGLVKCSGCRTSLTLLPRESLELAWSEDVVCALRRRQLVTIYFCRACGQALLSDDPVAHSEPLGDGGSDVRLSR